MTNSESFKKTDERTLKIDRRIQNNLLRDSERKTKTSVWILVFLAVANYFYAAYYYFETTDKLSAYIQGIVATAFVMLAIFARKDAYQANLIALVLYISLLVIVAAFEPSGILSGIIIKLLIIAGLVKGMRAGKDVRDIKKRLIQLEAES